MFGPYCSKLVLKTWWCWKRVSCWFLCKSDCSTKSSRNRNEHAYSVKSLPPLAFGEDEEEEDLWDLDVDLAMTGEGEEFPTDAALSVLVTKDVDPDELVTKPSAVLFFVAT